MTTQVLFVLNDTESYRNFIYDLIVELYGKEKKTGLLEYIVAGARIWPDFFKNDYHFKSKI